MDLKLTELLAIYGALLSSFVFLWNVLKSRRKVAVKLIYGLESEEDDIKTGVYVFIQNPSAQVVHISGLSILHPWRKTNIFKVILESIKYRRWFSTYGWSTPIYPCIRLMMAVRHQSSQDTHTKF